CEIADRTTQALLGASAVRLLFEDDHASHPVDERDPPAVGRPYRKAAGFKRQLGEGAAPPRIQDPGIRIIPVEPVERDPVPVGRERECGIAALRSHIPKMLALAVEPGQLNVEKTAMPCRISHYAVFRNRNRGKRAGNFDLRQQQERLAAEAEAGRIERLRHQGPFTLEQQVSGPAGTRRIHDGARRAEDKAPVVLRPSVHRTYEYAAIRPLAAAHQVQEMLSVGKELTDVLVAVLAFLVRGCELY